MPVRIRVVLALKQSHYRTLSHLAATATYSQCKHQVEHTFVSCVYTQVISRHYIDMEVETDRQGTACQTLLEN